MEAGYMRRRRGSILSFQLVALAKGTMLSICAIHVDYGRGDISFQLTSRFLILLTYDLY